MLEPKVSRALDGSSNKIEIQPATLQFNGTKYKITESKNLVLTCPKCRIAKVGLAVIVELKEEKYFIFECSVCESVSSVKLSKIKEFYK